MLLGHEAVVPARAGVILRGCRSRADDLRGTRASGGDPKLPEDNDDKNKWYPRERG